MATFTPEHAAGRKGKPVRLTTFAVGYWIGRAVSVQFLRSDEKGRNRIASLELTTDEARRLASSLVEYAGKMDARAPAGN